MSSVDNVADGLQADGGGGEGAAQVVRLNPIPDTVEVLPGARGSYGVITTLVDAGGNVFHAFKNEETADANNTWIQVQRYAPSGALTGRWDAHPPSPFKIDGVGLFHSGADLIVSATTHTHGTGPRIKQVEAARIVGVFDYQPGFEEERGGPNAFVPGFQEPPPGGEVDYNEIERRMKFVVDTYVQPRIDEKAGAVISNIIPKVQYAFRHGLDETNNVEPAPAFRDALYSYLKNAAAGPLANVLGGQDEWGQARREELKDIVREVLAEQVQP